MTPIAEVPLPGDLLPVLLLGPGDNDTGSELEEDEFDDLDDAFDDDEDDFDEDDFDDDDDDEDEDWEEEEDIE